MGTLIENYYNKMTHDFHLNKKILDDCAHVPTKRLRNKIAGFATHLMKRIQTGPVKGISLKIQEEERERRLDYVPKVSNIQVDRPVYVDQATQDMFRTIAKIYKNYLRSNLSQPRVDQKEEPNSFTIN